MCEQLGQMPDPDKMPLEISVFPDEVQVAFFMFGMLSDRWDGASGTYMGKDWNHCDYLFSVYEIEDPKTILFFMKLYESLVIGQRMKDQENKRKADERRSKQASGTNYTHNVRG